MSNIFTPKADDKLAAELDLIEVATVKPSGYLMHRGIMPIAALPAVTTAINEYFAGKGRPEPVIYMRAVGTIDWTAQGVSEVIIPDELPENFS